jgi:hypothetical protein
MNTDRLSMRIDDYAFGRIRVDGKPYSADLILFPGRIEENWWRKRGHLLQIEDLSGLPGTPFDILIIGTGAHGAMQVERKVEQWLAKQGILWEKHPTGEACQRYNTLVAEGKRVIAALHLTC